jgi:hypothetical protein
MAKRTLSSLALLLVALWAFLPKSPSPARAATEPLLVVAGLTFPAQDVRLADLKSAFRGTATLVAGKRLIPVNHTLETPLRIEFDRVVLGLEPAAVGRFWVDRRIRDEGSPPTTVAPEMAVRVAASLPGAVTYATKAMLNPKLKVLSVEGKHASQPGYPLRP